MAARIAQQLAAAADLLRPRTFFRTLARVDEVTDKTRALEATVEALRLRTEKLETIARLDWELQNEVARLPQILDPARIEPHIRAALASATLVEDPFPHIVVERWLPTDVYQIIVRALPPAVFFSEKEMSRQRLTVPFSFAPTYSRRVWTFVAEEIVDRILCEALTARFASVIDAFVRDVAGDAAAEQHPELRTSDGRIMLRRPGYVIPPHRDPKWGFVTGLVYLARDGDPEEHGTSLYRVRGRRRSAERQAVLRRGGALRAGEDGSLPRQHAVRIPQLDGRPRRDDPRGREAGHARALRLPVPARAELTGDSAAARGNAAGAQRAVGRRQGAQGRSPLTLSITLAQLEARD